MLLNSSLPGKKSIVYICFTRGFLLHFNQYLKSKYQYAKQISNTCFVSIALLSIITHINSGCDHEIFFLFLLKIGLIIVYISDKINVKLSGGIETNQTIRMVLYKISSVLTKSTHPELGSTLT